MQYLLVYGEKMLSLEFWQGIACIVYIYLYIE